MPYEKNPLIGTSLFKVYNSLHRIHLTQSVKTRRAWVKLIVLSGWWKTFWLSKPTMFSSHLRPGWWDSCGYLLLSCLVIYTNQPCQHRLSQVTTPSTSSGHHWQCMAREHPFEGNYGASQTLWKRRVGNAKRRMRGLSLSPQALANWF